MHQDHIKITTKDGYHLSATIRKPSTATRGVIQFNGGTGIPQSVYANLASFLTENGYITVTYDYRGIGQSKPATLKGFSASLEDWAIFDMTGVFDWILKEYPHQKKIVIGHSLGGQLVGLMENNIHIDQLFLIASSTGYWRDMSSPFKWLMPPLWFLFIPLTTFVYGYANAKKIRQGEDLPKGVALQWRKWCIHPNYFETHFEQSNTPLFFENVKIPLKSIQITDDPIANEITANKLLQFYKNAKIEVEQLIPSQLNVSKIGHTGYFSRKFKDNLWQNLLNDIGQKTYA